MKNSLKISGLLSLLITFLWIITPLSGHPNERDSIRQLILATHDIEKKIEYYVLLAKHFLETDLDSASLIINRALVLSDETGSPDELGEVHAVMGDIAVMQDSLSVAIAHYHQALDMFAAEEKHHDEAMVLMVLGNLGLVTEDFRSAVMHYFDALKIAEEHNYRNIIASISNNLGIIYFESGETKQALSHYDRAYEISREMGNSMGIANALINMGDVYIDLEQYDLARDYTMEAYSMYDSMGNITGRVQCLFNLARIEQSHENHLNSITYLDSCLLLLELPDQTYKGPKNTIYAGIYLELGLSNQSLGRDSEALAFFNKAFSTASDIHQLAILVTSAEKLTEIYAFSGSQDSMLKYMGLYREYLDEFNEDRTIRTTDLLGLQLEYEKKLGEQKIRMQAVENSQSRKNLIFLISTLGLVLILIIFALLLKLEKNKKKNVELARGSLEAELEYRNKELTTYVMHLMGKSELIISILEKIKRMRPADRPERDKIVEELIIELESDPGSFSWQDFEIRFQKVHTGYYKTLSKMFPDLTPNELRLCAFLRLNMTTKEIASITYQSLKSIDMARYRLRKKLGMDQDENLITFLQKI